MKFSKMVLILTCVAAGTTLQSCRADKDLRTANSNHSTAEEHTFDLDARVSSTPISTQYPTYLFSYFRPALKQKLRAGLTYTLPVNPRLRCRFGDKAGWLGSEWWGDIDSISFKATGDDTFEMSYSVTPNQVIRVIGVSRSWGPFGISKADFDSDAGRGVWDEIIAAAITARATTTSNIIYLISHFYFGSGSTPDNAWFPQDCREV